ncbi:MAG: penicillin-binding protein 2 [Gammaproteobacteria bacterium]|uniref:Peptidoglycan D,D-transpeptidase MrdA n=1 Tax=Candidatus Thiopontia autotrophica TaxID=2841688 RepID=A0A8J6TRY1_9GAMM|nr:penicillin-binding protein 2 [Candidatus Thiopontia autotrophica]
MIPTLKDHHFEARMFRTRVIVSIGFVIFMVLVLIFRVFNLQIIQHDHFTTLSDDNRVHTQPISPPRGNIYDRNGVLLASNRTTFRLEITPGKVTNMADTLKRISPLISYNEEDLERFHRERRRAHKSDSVPLRFSLNEDEVARFEVNRHKFPGVAIRDHQTRHYPLHNLTAHLIGYIGRINEAELQQIDPRQYRGTEYIGKTGIEHYYEDILRGTPGMRQVESNVLGRSLRILEETNPTPGDNLFLTIDSKLQSIADEAMGEYRGAVVAIHPKTGEVLAMLSKPSFNANLFVNGISRNAYQELRDSKDRPLFNRFLRGQYPPGSTVKPLMALAGLETKQIHADESTFCRGWYQIKGYRHKYRDWKKRGHGDTDLDKAIVESCDVYFYNLAYRMGIDAINQYVGQFGFGKRTGVDITGEQPGVLPSRQWKEVNLEQPWYPGETLSVGIGQGFFTATPLQLSSATATLANQGQRMQPRLLYAIQGAGAKTPQLQPYQSLNQIPIKRQANWDQIHESMRRVVHSRRGTAKKVGRKSKYTIAGKTGTAQVYTIKQGDTYDEASLPEHLRDHALFVAFAPQEDPEIAIAVIIENGGHGGSVAAPIAKQVMDQYLLESAG